jgi:hypothetical protein
MLTAALEARRQPQRLDVSEPFKRDNRDQARLSFGQGAGLVDHNRVHLLLGQPEANPML